jgi:asparagine synthase (glutamine-hydrolysing)
MMPTFDTSDPRVRSYASMLRRFEGSDLDRFCRMASRSGLAGAALLKGHLSHLWSDHRSLLDNACYVETRIFLQPLLQMADRMSMAHAVEARNPFLDYRLVEFAFTLDDSLRFRDGVGKWLVKAAANRLLPRDCLVLTREVKHGLPTPINLWLQGQASFDRKYWTAIMTAECIKSLQRLPPR